MVCFTSWVLLHEACYDESAIDTMAAARRGLVVPSVALLRAATWVPYMCRPMRTHSLFHIGARRGGGTAACFDESATDATHTRTAFQTTVAASGIHIYVPLGADSQHVEWGDC